MDGNDWHSLGYDISTIILEQKTRVACNIRPVLIGVSSRV
jgi:hypothetical protein